MKLMKEEARNMYREKRMQLTDGERTKMDDLLLIQFQKLELPFVSSVLSFYPIDAHKEINSFLLTDYLRFKNPGLQIAYPKINTKDITMDAIITESEQFATNKYGIDEPAEGYIVDPASLDLVLVPLFIFDRKGTRVGYGKGFYDRYLPGCRKDCVKVGVSYFEPVDRIEDAQDFDVPLDFCISPQSVYVF